MPPGRPAPGGGESVPRRVAGSSTAADLAIRVLPGTFAICRLEPDAQIPPWAMEAEPGLLAAGATFLSVTRTAAELSIVCPDGVVPDGVRAERGFAALAVEGPLDFSLVGILARITTTLANAGISLFALSTFDTDYILVRSRDLASARESLSRAGMRLRVPDGPASI